MPLTSKTQIELRLNDLREPAAALLQSHSSDPRANLLLAAMVNCGFHRRCRSRVCPVCVSIANLKNFDSVATAIRTFEDECDFISFAITEPDVPIQSLRKTLDEMAGKLSRQLERRKGVINGAFLAFESVPAPAAESGSERIDMEHAHCHVLLAVQKGQADSRRLEAFEKYIVTDPKHGLITAGSAISVAYYNTKSSVFGSFTKNRHAILEHNFIQRAVQLSGFHRYRCTGIFRDRELPAHLQKSLDEIESELNAAGAELNATALSSTDSDIRPVNEQENLCVPDSTQVQPLESKSTDSPLSARQDTIMTAGFKYRSPVIAVGSLEPDGIAFAAAKRVPVAAVAL